MKILVTGANGFLGYYLVDQLLKNNHQVLATGRGESKLDFNGRTGFSYAKMDFTDPFAVHDLFQVFQPAAVVHAGAMTKVDECELNQWQTYLVNVEGTINLLLNAEEHKAFFVFLSTDFVFSGEEGMYSEDDRTNPVNFYGKTKVEAEDAVKEYEHGWAIVRTILVYGKPMTGSSNILTIVKDKLEKGEEYRLVTDQQRTPTYVEDLAGAIVTLLERKTQGIFHISGKDRVTPYEMGQQIAGLSGFDGKNLVPVDSSNFSQPAKRPPKTGFSIEKARKLLDYDPVTIQEGLKRSLKN